jgi:DNA mismatch endonuclease (patch repair protein)
MPSFSIDTAISKRTLSFLENPSPSPPGPAKRSITGTFIKAVQSLPRRRGGIHRRGILPGKPEAMASSGTLFVSQTPRPMDIVDPSTRSRMMASIRGRDTSPEILVRSYLHRAGLRFTTHARGLPGRPDLLLPKFKTAIFVHGCFWHRHPGCRFAAVPKTRASFWNDKFAANIARDEHAKLQLESAGWHVIVVWACQLQDTDTLDKLFWHVIANGANSAKQSPQRRRRVPKSHGIK